MPNILKEMNTNVNLLLVDDDKFHLNIFANKLSYLKFNQIRIASTIKEAIDAIYDQTPDLIITDFYLENGKSALDIFRGLQIPFPIPTIVISTYYNHDVLNQIREINLVDFLPKNASDFEIEKSIILNLNRNEHIQKLTILNDFFLVKSGRYLKKIIIDNIEYITVDGKYLKIFADGSFYMIRSTLNDFIARLPSNFIKMHQSYIVNLNFIQSVNLDENIVNFKVGNAPFSRTFKKLLLSKYFIS